MLSSALMQTVQECHARAVELFVSGPAAGPAAALHVAGRLGHRDVLEMDMGGTSFDVCVIRDGEIPTTREAWVGQERIATKMVDVATVGAGGGSIAWIDGLGLLRVGPESAGADPGPAAYGLSDRPTVTDADLVLGYVSADYFLGGKLRLDRERALAAVASVSEPLGVEPEDAAEAIFDTVNGVMADAVAEVCTKRGLDVRDFVMVSGGGAGGVHGAEIARLVGIPQVLCPPTAPVLSALGMLTMDVGRELTRAGIWDRTAVTADEINAVFAALKADQQAAFRNAGIADERVSYRRSLAMRYLGQFHEILVDVPDRDLGDADRTAVETDFHRRHEKLYGYALPWRAIEILECHLRGSAPQDSSAPPAEDRKADASAPSKTGERACRLGGVRRHVPTYRRDTLAAGHSFAGPALIDSETSTVLVPPAFSVHVDAGGTLVLRLDPAEKQAPRLAHAEGAKK
jgi:N-methylhydantoinase A